MRQIFVTGASGFIGQTLIRSQAATADRFLKILTRRPFADQPQQVVGDLLEPETYRAALEGCDVVVHLAAATGRAAPRDYDRVNVEGTRALLEACKAAGVRRFLYVSTIAAGYANQRYYPYAKTKAKAESLVRASGLDFTILRPTLVLGEKSPIWNTLLKIAGLPVIPLPEGRSSVRVQPVLADDVVRGIALILERDRFQGETLELGGPQPLPFAEFVRLIQRGLRGKSGKIISVPLAPIRFGLAAMEPALRPLMPVTAGQLSVFANDSVASENWLLAELRPTMASPENMVAALLESAKRSGSAQPARMPQRHAMPISETAKRALVEECRVLGSYLVGTAPGAYVEERYVIAAQTHGLAAHDDASCIDRATLKLARSGRFFARWADAYCAFFRRGGVLRRKLVLLAAILEHVAPTSDAFDRVKPRGMVMIALSLAWYGLVSAISLLLGAAILVPAAMVCWITAHTAGANERARQAL